MMDRFSSEADSAEERTDASPFSHDVCFLLSTRGF